MIKKRERCEVRGRTRKIVLITTDAEARLAEIYFSENDTVMLLSESAISTMLVKVHKKPF